MTKTAYFIGGEWDGVKRQISTPLDRIEVAKMRSAHNNNIMPYSRYDITADIIYDRDVYRLATILEHDVHVYQLEETND